jgi:succinate-acetate transporter protein
MSDDKLESSASLVPFGLLSLSIATFLIGFAAILQLKIAPAPFFTSALLFGGIGEFLAGIWAFAYRDSIVGTVFSFLGLFYVWFGLTNLLLPPEGLERIADMPAVSMGMVFLTGGLLTLFLWTACRRESSGLNLSLLFLWISFLLLAAGFFTNFAIVGIAGGISAILSSLIAAIASFGELHRQAGLGEVPTVDQLAEKARARLAARVGPVDRLARRARETLADKIRPNGAPQSPDGP